MVSQALDERLALALGNDGWLSRPNDMERHVVDWLGRRAEGVVGVALPRNAVQTAAVVRLCREANIVIVPQGGNTGLVQGALPTYGRKSVIVSTDRMNAIGPINVVDGCVEVGAGVALHRLNEVLAGAEMQFPLRLGSEGNAQVGGLVATNAGGNQALRFGMVRDHVLGLEVVLPTGEIWNGLRNVRKDNSGYQLRTLFCGSEGTLGIVTRAVLAIRPAIVRSSTALLGVTGYEDALRVSVALKRTTGDFLTSLDFFSERGIGMVEAQFPDLRSPLSTRCALYMLVELSSSVDTFDTDALLQAGLEALLEQAVVLDGVVAGSKAQQAELWRLREEIPEAQRLAGSQLKHDIALPASRLPAFMDVMQAELDAILPGVIVNAFGHLGDGNVHFNLSPPCQAADFSGKEAILAECVYRHAELAGGSFAAEHGLGRQKVSAADALRSGEERTIIRAIKRAFDPDAIMNVGCSV